MLNNIALDSDIYLFNDSSEVLHLLSQKPDKQVKKFQKFLRKIARKYDDAEPLFKPKDPLNDSTGATLVHILELSEKWLGHSTSVAGISLATRRVADADALEEFQQLDSKTQQQIITSIFPVLSPNPFLACADKAFFRLLKMTGFPVTALKSIGRECSMLYYNEIRATHRKFAEQHPEDQDFLETRLEMPSDKFLEQALRHVDNYRLPPVITSEIAHGNYRISFDPYAPQFAFMLRAIYGERNVIEVLDRFVLDQEYICPNEMIDVLANWDELRNYPTEWIRHMKNLQH